MKERGRSVRWAAIGCRSIFAVLGAAIEATGCDSTTCLLLTRGQNGVLARGVFRFDVSLRYTSQSQIYVGSRPGSEVVRPKVDFEQGRFIPGYHRELGGQENYLQVDVGYGLTSRLTLLASAPLMARRYYRVEHFGFNVGYSTRGIGDTLVGVRYRTTRGLAAAAAVELPTGESRGLSPYNEGILDPTLQPGSGSFDFVTAVQYTVPARPVGLDLTLSGSYQLNTRNDLGYRFGNDSIVTLGLSRGLPRGVTASVQVKGFHKQRSDFLGLGVPSTGGTVVYLTPGLRVNAGSNVSLYGFVQIPFYRNVNEAQLVPRASLVVGFSTALLAKPPS